MTWRPERGWFSLCARVGVAGGGALVLAAGLASGPVSLVPAAPSDTTVVRAQPGQPLPARPVIKREPTRVAAARVGARADVSRDIDRASDESEHASTSEPADGTETSVVPAGSDGGTQPASGGGSAGGGTPQVPDHSGSGSDGGSGGDNPAEPESSGEGSAGDDANDPPSDDSGGGHAPDDNSSKSEDDES